MASSCQIKSWSLIATRSMVTGTGISTVSLNPPSHEKNRLIAAALGPLGHRLCDGRLFIDLDPDRCGVELERVVVHLEDGRCGLQLAFVGLDGQHRVVVAESADVDALDRDVARDLRRPRSNRSTQKTPAGRRKRAIGRRAKSTTRGFTMRFGERSCAAAEGTRERQ